MTTTWKLQSRVLFLYRKFSNTVFGMWQIIMWVANLQIFVESSVKLYQYLLEEGEISVL